MEIHARLVHAEAGRRVVEVRASRGEHSLGSALAEAGSAQEAEDLALARLLGRLAGHEAGPPQQQARPQQPMPDRPAAPSAASGRSPASSQGQGQRTEPASRASGGVGLGAAASSGGTAGAPAAADLAATAAAAPARASTPQPRPIPAPRPQASSPEPEAHPPAGPDLAPEALAVSQSDPGEEPPADPEDWSQELAAIDVQLRRLSWSREQEGAYLQRAFGHPSRSRLTRYNDLRAYLTALEALAAGSDPALAAVPLRRSELLAQGDALLAQLGWSAEQGRALLERELQRVSRQQLSDVQLLQFNMLLESELLSGGATAASMATPEGAQR